MSLSRIIVWIVVLVILVAGVFMLINRNAEQSSSSDTNSLAGGERVVTPESVIDSAIVPETDDVSIGELI